MVTVVVPSAAEPLAVKVAVVAHVGLQAFWLKEATTPDGRPEAEKVADWVVPEVSVALTELATKLPCASDLAPPLERLKSNVGGGGSLDTTVRLKLLVLEREPAAAVTTIGYVPGTAESLAVKVAVLEQVGLQEATENAAVTPAGMPEAENATGWVVPEESVAVKRKLVDLPCTTSGPRESEKSNAGGGGGVEPSETE